MTLAPSLTSCAQCANGPSLAKNERLAQLGEDEEL
jgi:hypothetical protein